MIEVSQRGASLRKRNRYTAAGISLLASTFIFYRNQLGVQWFPWRDAPLLAGTAAALALALLYMAWRTARREVRR